MKNKKSEGTSHEPDPAPIDLDALNSLLSDEDEMDGCDEIHLSYATPVRKNNKFKPPDLVSVKSKVKTKRKNKK